MTNDLLIILYFIALGLGVANALLVTFKPSRLVNILGVAIVLVSLCSYVLTYHIYGHVPIYSKFATLQNIVLILSALGVFYNRTPQQKNNNINILWYVILALQAYILTQKMEANPDYFMYDKLYVVLFFQLRIAAIALFVFALSHHIIILTKEKGTAFTRALAHRARNFTLLGAVFYLGGEFSGSYWCFLWWGDPWHWSRGFFLASAMFLLSMVGSHLPLKFFNTIHKQAWSNIAGLGVIVVIYLISH